jgi:hypothetical protein
MIKVLSSVDSASLLNEYISLRKDMQWTGMGSKGKQVGLQYQENEDPWTSSVGKSRGNELEYSHLNPFFKNTKFELVINEFKLYRSRLIWLESYSCYSMHADSTPRIHIPLITNKHCYFVFKDTGLVSHLPANNVYWVDTTKTHTFMNCSEDRRLHLVGIIDENI